MPNKLDKYGITIFWACDAEMTIRYPYLRKEATGVRFGGRNFDLAAFIVQTLTKDFQWTRSNVTCGNYFSNLSSAKTLAKQNLTIVGTVKRSKTHFNRFPLLFIPETALITYQSKGTQNVILLSTMQRFHKTKTNLKFFSTTRGEWLQWTRWYTHLLEIGRQNGG